MKIKIILFYISGVILLQCLLNLTTIEKEVYHKNDDVVFNNLYYTVMTLEDSKEDDDINNIFGWMSVDYDDKTFHHFINMMGYKESSNDYSSVNSIGYKGRFQFGRESLKDLKIYHRKDFLENKKLQDSAFIGLLSINKHRLIKYINKYDGKNFKGIVITESGILAAAHLVGAGSVIKFFKKGVVSSDGNGVTLMEYLDMFSGYSMNVRPVKDLNLKEYSLKNKK